MKGDFSRWHHLFSYFVAIFRSLYKMASIIKRRRLLSKTRIYVCVLNQSTMKRRINAPEDKRTYSKSYEKELTNILTDSILCLCLGMSESLKVGKSYSTFKENQSLRHTKLERK